MNSILKILFFLSFSGTMFAQISPGELSNAHKKLEGIRNCTECHELGNKGISKSKCLKCHTLIGKSITNNYGFHSSPGALGKNCSECHGEHFGRDFEVVRFNEKDFDHAKTTFRLTGKHSEIECSKCHSASNIKIEELKNRKDTFLGLDKKCVSCHEDFHQGTLLSNNCLDCHSTDKWRPATLFSHDNAKFKLSGAHKNVLCEKCHMKGVRNNKEFQKFTGIKFNNCVDCHKDIHAGKFGNNCTECHSLISFKKVKNLSLFNHSKTNFQLIGKHKGVNCNKCHRNGIRKKLKYDTCIDCHEDFHKGEFSKNGRSEDCSKCHTEFGFAPSHFTIEEHSNLLFQLTGGHSAIPCNECHFIDSKWKFSFEDIGCEACHDNVHKNYLTDAAFIEECEDCHSTESWNKIIFNHNKTEFVLIGNHKDVSCAECHFTDASLPHRFTVISKECKSCHEDKHDGQFLKKYKNNCAKCHNPNNWLVKNFNHSGTKFPLEGAHKNVQCSECHKKVEINNKIIIQFTFNDISCKSCHI